MIRENSFVLSHRPYAVDLASLRALDHMNIGEREHNWYGVNAAWFRRRSVGYGRERHLVTVACVGQLRDLQRHEPGTAGEFLHAHDDGRYGGDCEGRWDGERYWGSQLPDVIERHLVLLRPMLAAYPACPDGFDGWWTFR